MGYMPMQRFVMPSGKLLIILLKKVSFSHRIRRYGAMN
jgi:hypothetical protein